MLEVGKLILEYNGYKIIVANNADEALAAFGDGSGVDLVIADVRMPGMRGPELCAKLRQIQPKARVAIVTGSAGDGEKLPYPTLYKPFAIDKLLGFVRDQLEA
jgi:CheY-like chemotaxis protein